MVVGDILGFFFFFFWVDEKKNIKLKWWTHSKFLFVEHKVVEGGD